MEIRRDPGTAALVDFMGNQQRIVDAARVSIGGQKPRSTDEKLLKYLWNNGHTSPFEHVSLSFRIECPIFTARQIMRHRTFSYNEVSGRYSVLDAGYYLPVALYPQNPENKQGTENEPMPGARITIMGVLLNSINDTYNSLINNGVSREQARTILPVATFTSFYMSGNLLNWIKFLTLRLDDHAQYEVWYIARQIAAVIEEDFPIIWDIIKEDIHGETGTGSESRHALRLVQEARISKESSRHARRTRSYGSKVPATGSDNNIRSNERKT